MSIVKDFPNLHMCDSVNCGKLDTNLHGLFVSFKLFQIIVWGRFLPGPSGRAMTSFFVWIPILFLCSFHKELISRIAMNLNKKNIVMEISIRKTGYVVFVDLRRDFSYS